MPTQRAGMETWVRPNVISNKTRVFLLILLIVNAFGSCMGSLGAIPCIICCPNPYKQVHQGNVGLVTKFGKFYKAVDPGLVKINGKV